MRRLLPLLALVACSPSPAPAPGSPGSPATSGATATADPDDRPRPTDPLDEGEEGGEDQARRAAWLEAMHRAAPGTDWRALERANQEAERLRRNGLATMLESPLGLGDWQEVGSKNQAGHTRCAVYGPERAGQRWLYVGSANGGLWRSPMDGSDWRPLSDALFGGVDEVCALTPASLADEDVLVMRRGTDLYRSDDGGVTWTVPAGVGGLTEVRAMLRVPDGSETILMLARGGGDVRLYASTDLGQSFQVRQSWPTDWRGDLWIPQTGPGVGSQVYVVQTGSIRRSLDNGFTWSNLGAIDPSAERGHLCGSEAGAPTLYTVLRIGGEWRLYRSDDGGATHTDLGVPPAYWGTPRSLAAFSSDPLAVVVGGVEGWRSADGGQSFTRINTWGAYYGSPQDKLHADLRGITCWPDPDQPAGTADLLYFNTDGGTYRSTDRGQSVWNLSLEGLGVGQFYSTHTSANDPDLILGGTQDQGYQRGYRQSSVGPGPSTNLDQLISGDYGHLCSSDGSHEWVFCTYPGFVLIQHHELTPSLDLIDFPAGSSHLWLPPVVADPGVTDDFFFLGRYLWHYDHVGGNTWTPSQHSAHDFAAGSGSYLSALAFAPSQPTTAYAVTDAGRLWRSSDGGVTWTEAQDTGPSSHYFYGNALVVDPLDPQVAYVGGSGYSTAGVRRTLDGGVTWQPLDSGLPPTLVYDLCLAPDGSGDLYAATEAGAYRFDAAGGAWENAMGVEAPATTYWSVEAVAGSQTVRFGTYGRGIWDLVLSDTGGLGLRYCSPATANSTSQPGELLASGSAVATDNDLTLTATGLPANQFGYFLASLTPDFVPNAGGSWGDLCLGGNLVRFVAQTGNSGASGTFQADIDLTAVPANPLHSVVAGETWYFQAWYRDVILNPTSNFTDALEISFQ